MTCPSDETLACWVDGKLPEAERARTEAHAAACDVCRRAVEGLSEPGEGMPAALRGRLETLLPPARFRWVPLAAAALLLGAVALWRSGIEDVPRESQQAVQTKPAVPPWPVPRLAADGRLASGSQDLSFPLGRSGLLTLKAGSRGRLLPTGEFELEAGAAWMESPGEPLRLRLDETLVTLEEGVLLAEMDASTHFSWLAQAHAGAGPGAWRLTLIEGKAVLDQGGESQPLRPGEEARWQAGRLEVGTASAPLWRGDRGWQPAPGLPRKVQAGVLELGAPSSGDHEWEAVFRRDAATGVSVLARAGEQGVAFPLGSVLAQAGTGLLRVRVVSRQGWLRLEAGGAEIFFGPASEAFARFPSPDALCGLRSWGGGLEVLQARWRTP